MNSAIARARSFLFVPASQPERFAKALKSGAGCVILDLEDAVAPEQKGIALDHLADSLPGFGRAQLGRTLVRINAAGTSWHEEDLRLLAGWTAQGLAGVVVPKAEEIPALQAVGAALGAAAKLVLLVESLAGLDAVHLLARTPQVTRLAFGHLDFQLDLGMRCGPEEVELASARFALVAASRRAQLPAPVDGVTVDTANVQRLLDDSQRARAFGFGGKLCIHPTQVRPVEESFSPSPTEVEWAHRVLSAARSHQGQAFSLDGRMVDLPVVRLAEQTLLYADAS
jgi:citrate lyase subunit beta/citryl-CoA lyase